MRTKRAEKFKRHRHNKNMGIFILTVMLPFTTIFLGYLIISLFILPSLKK